ncbi:hypothetical protein [Rhizobium leguminosarum]|uniref:hypothetical protein n=1 Tax=Rhizobium leguminosarum TaxID=384 RepID=UPI003F9C66AE
MRPTTDRSCPSGPRATGPTILRPSAINVGGVDDVSAGVGKIVEHWDTIEAIPAQSEWKNQNGKF